MRDAIVSGILAGYAIAIPVGAMAVLIVDHALRGGFRSGFAGGLGVATTDLIYAGIAAFAGSALAEVLEPWEGALSIASATILAGFAAFLAVTALRAPPPGADPVRPPPAPRVFVRFLGLTLINPPTVAFFAAVVIGMGADALPDLGLKIAFAVAAFAASLSWQTTLAAIGAILHRRLPVGARMWAGLVGAGFVALLALRTAITALT